MVDEGEMFSIAQPECELPVHRSAVLPVAYLPILFIMLLSKLINYYYYYSYTYYRVIVQYVLNLTWLRNFSLVRNAKLHFIFMRIPTFFSLSDISKLNELKKNMWVKFKNAF